MAEDRNQDPQMDAEGLYQEEISPTAGWVRFAACPRCAPTAPPIPAGRCCTSARRRS